MRRAWLLAVALAATSCSAVLRFHECDQDSDCASGDGGMLFCTDDHMCVGALPDSRLCSVSTPGGDGALVVAGLYKLSTSGGTDDHAIRQAADLAASELKTSAGFAVTHVACDTNGDPAQAARALRVAVEQYHAVAVVGPDTSGEILDNAGVGPVVQKYGAAIVSPSATNPAIADLDDGGLVWRTCPSDNLQARVLAQLVPATSSLDIVWVSPNAYADGLEKAFVAASGRTDATPISFKSGMAATAVQQMNAPAYALLIADVDAPDLVQALKAATGQSMTQYLMTDSALAPSLWGDAPFDFTLLSRIRGTAPALPAFADPSGPVYAAFAQSYKGRFQQEDPANTAFVANAYDAFYAIAVAAAGAGPKPTGAQIAANLGRLSSHDASAVTVRVGPLDFQAGVNALSGGGVVDLVGTSGPIDFDDRGDIVSAPIEVWKIAQDTSGMPKFESTMVVTP